MCYPSSSTRFVRAMRPMRVLGAGILCTVILAGYSLAEAKPPRAKSAARSGEAPKAQTDTGSEDTPTAQPGAIRKPTPPRPARAKRKGAPNFVMDPNAKFVCEEPVQSLPPTWRGGQDPTYSFDIKNTGTADLKILAKGG